MRIQFVERALWIVVADAEYLVHETITIRVQAVRREPPYFHARLDVTLRIRHRVFIARDADDIPHQLEFTISVARRRLLCRLAADERDAALPTGICNASDDALT